MLVCDRRIWRKIDTMKSGGDLMTSIAVDADEEADESARWSWYIS